MFYYAKTKPTTYFCILMLKIVLFALKYISSNVYIEKMCKCIDKKNYTVTGDSVFYINDNCNNCVIQNGFVKLYCDTCRERNRHYSTNFQQCGFCHKYIHTDCQSWKMCPTCIYRSTKTCTHCSKSLYKCGKCLIEGCNYCTDYDNHKERRRCNKKCEWKYE